MKINPYTKAVLTVIAVCLAILCWQNFRVPQVHAQTVQPVVIVGAEQAVPVGIVGWGAPQGEFVGAKGWVFGQGIPVRLASRAGPVAVVSDSAGRESGKK
jgi:hypothetical protein